MWCSAIITAVYWWQTINFYSFSVVRAKVLSQEWQKESLVIGQEWQKESLVFGLRILKTYKGASELNQTEGIQVYGSRQRSLFAKAYTRQAGSMCGVEGLQTGKVYFITGKIYNSKLNLNLCGWIAEWSQVTPRQRGGARRFYGPNCDCQITPCYGDHCPKLQGCNTSEHLNPYNNDCEWKHTYCSKNTNGTACAWQETAEYKNCTKIDEGLP